MFACVNTGVSVFAQLCVCVSTCLCWSATRWGKKKRKGLPVGPTGPFEHLKSSSLYCLHWIPRGATLEFQSERIQSWHQGSCSQLWQEEFLWAERIHWQGLTLPVLDLLDFHPQLYSTEARGATTSAKTISTASNKSISVSIDWCHIDTSFELVITFS